MAWAENRKNQFALFDFIAPALYIRAKVKFLISMIASMFDYSKLSDEELKKMIASASKELAGKQEAKRCETIAKIQSLAESIGVKVEIKDKKSPSREHRGKKVIAKYRNASTRQTWSGRGLMPNWLKALVEQGHNLEDFKI